MKFLINKETAMAKKIEGSRNQKTKTLAVQFEFGKVISIERTELCFVNA